MDMLFLLFVSLSINMVLIAVCVGALKKIADTTAKEEQVKKLLKEYWAT
jgi:hypothetical protein